MGPWAVRADVESPSCFPGIREALAAVAVDAREAKLSVSEHDVTIQLESNRSPAAED